MKKLFLACVILLTLTLITSCTNDKENVNPDDGPNPPSLIKAKIDGVMKTYNVVAYEHYTNGGQNYTRVSGSVNGNPANSIELNVRRGMTGINSKVYVVITNDGETFEDGTLADEHEININTIVNSTKKITGSFSGEIESDTPTVLTITEGTFEYYY